MGFDISAINFLLYLKHDKVNFDNTLTLGRQSYQLSDEDLKKCFSLFNIKKSNAILFKQVDPEYVEPFLQMIGSKQTDSMDASDYEHATIIHDLNNPISEEYWNKYDAVIDAGTLEHVFNFPVAISNVMKLVKTGGSFIGITPANNFFGHGFYQFSPELFYRVFSEENGFTIEKLFFTTVGSFSWYEVPDPKQVKKRVTLKNTKQSYLLVHAKKIAEKPLLISAPQQSDYEHLVWKEGQSISKKKTNVLQHIAKHLPEKAKQEIRKVRQRIQNKKLNLYLNDYGDGDRKLFKKFSIKKAILSKD